MKRIISLCIVISSFISQNMKGDVLGSDTNVSLVPSYVFPASSSTNRIANLASVHSGFSLQNNLTTCEFDSIFPVSGTIALNGGTLNLNKDLIFNNITTLQSFGRVNGNGYTFALSPSITFLPTSTYQFIQTDIFLNNDVTINSTITFKNCFIHGNGYQLILGPNASVQIANGSTLTLKSLVLNGVNGNNVLCNNNNASLILDDVDWIQSGNFTFNRGFFSCKNHVTFKGDALFAYQTPKASVINSNATLQLDAGFTFSYDPSSGSKNLLTFTDGSSALLLNNATVHATLPGLNLKAGTMIVRGNSVVCSEVAGGNDQGVTLGDGTGGDDFAVDVTTGASLYVGKGSLNYKNVSGASWLMENYVSTLKMGPSTTLRLHKTLDLGVGAGVVANNVTIARVPSAQLLGSVTALGHLLFEQI